jgi:hypothetical protein
MKVQVDICERKTVENAIGEVDYKHIQLYSEIENWDVCESTAEVFKEAQQDYGRCISKVFIDLKDGGVRHIGWSFEKRVKYTDCNEIYLQETWIVPLKT